MPFLVVKSRTIKFTIFVIIVACLLSISIDGVNAAQVYFGYPAKKCLFTALKPKKKSRNII